jgi:hypothetical protein
MPQEANPVHPKEVSRIMEPTEAFPERGIKATFMLADSAQASEGKLYVLGGGWNVIGAQTGPFAVAGIIEIPWGLTNQQHNLRFELIDLDGNPVTTTTPEGEQPCVIEAQFEVGRPPGVRRGAMFPMPVAIPHPPLELAPGGHYEWRFEINGTTHEDWRLAFSTRPEAQSMAA